LIVRVVVLVAGRHLSLAERGAISAMRARGDSCREIGVALGRSHTTISRELGRVDVRVRGVYAAYLGQVDADARRARPKVFKLGCDSRLRREVIKGLDEDWSAEQITGRLVRVFPDDPEMRVSHTTIYRSIYVLGRSGLVAELDKPLRSGRWLPKARSKVEHSRIKDGVPIGQRPAEADDRAVPGHWEGDLIKGKLNRSAMITLVERRSRFVLLGGLPHGFKADPMLESLTEAVAGLPEALKRSLTWDRGTEMSIHKKFTIATDLAVYLADPHSPWQRPTNENTNGLVRQYFPKGTDLAIVPAQRITEVVDKLNNRPRKVLNFATPAEVFYELVQP